jgi:hypothetical protein
MYFDPLAALMAAWRKWRSRQSISPPPPPPSPPTLTKPTKPTKPDQQDEPDATAMPLTSIVDVLDKLPKTMRTVASLKRNDPDTYSLLSKLGAPIVSEDHLFHIAKVEPQFCQSWPVFRGVFIGYGDDGKETIPASGLYIVREENPLISMRRHDAKVYRLGILYDSDRGQVMAEAYAAIDAIGTVTPLKMPTYRTQTIQHKKQNGKTTISHRAYDYPQRIKDIAAELKHTPETLIRQMVYLASWGRLPHDCIMVRVHKGRVAVAFGIDKTDGKRFFRQRDGGITASGSRKKILHWVDPFTRQGLDGEPIQVRGHYRGERSFRWKEYRVKISGLGFHHENFYDADIVPESVADNDLRPGMIDTSKASSLIAKRYDEQRFLSSAKSTKRFSA